MIDVRELRIGNKFYYSNEEIGTVSYHEIRLLIIAIEKPNYNPIPLTEEWLLKFGFEKKPLVHWHGNGYDYQPKDSGTRQQDFVLTLPNGDAFIVRFEEFYFKDSVDSCRYILDCNQWYEKISEDKISCSLEFVHNLQNIFYCLKARELKLI